MPAVPLKRGSSSQRPKESRERARSKCVVVGVGNPLMKDDGIGIAVARALRRLSVGRNAVVMERQALDVSILDLAEGASKLIIVDAVKYGRPPGSVIKFRAGERRAPILRAPLSHEQDLGDILALARKVGVRLPPIVVVGVEPADCTSGEGLSELAAKALPRAVREVEGEVIGRASRGRGRAA